MSIILAFYRFLLSLRYDIKIQGIEHLQKDGPILILPNHVALVDPQILVTYLGKYRQISPVISETYYNLPIFRYLFRSAHAIPVADIERGSTDTDDVRNMFSSIVHGLEDGRAILLYPAGKIYTQNFESIVGKQAAYMTVQAMPKGTRILAIRTRGLWGSIWSKAYQGDSPNLGYVVFVAILSLVSHLFFFVPKRSITLDIQDVTDTLTVVAKNELSDFNGYLENYYNAGGNETCSFIRHFWWYNDVAGKTEPENIRGSLAELAQTSHHDTSEVPEEVWETLRCKIAEIRKIEASSITNSANLILELHFDSLDLAELKSFVQAKYTVSSNPPLLDLKTVADLAIMAIGKSEQEEILPPCDWKIETAEILSKQFQDVGDTSSFLTLFRKVFSQKQDTPFVFDAIFGLQTRKTFVLKSYVVAEYIRSLPGTHIGIMLPATASASLLVVATLLAGKIPVMLNWTVGDRAFSHCLKFSGIQHILTSKAFFEKIRSPWLEKYQSMFVFLETAIPTISLSKKLLALIKAKLFLLPKNTSNGMVMLFTSGSESLPKAVRLTHENILSDIIGALNIFVLKEDDVLLGCLPPFHSFGFSINTILPLITGLRCAYTPDPNDAKTIAELMRHVGATTFTATPTFFRSMLGAAKYEELITLRYAVLGAEKCPPDLASALKIKNPTAEILEGYGITECSPVISINPVGGAKLGSVGCVIPSLDITIRAIDDIGQKMGTNVPGMIYVRGKSVFNGYLDASIASPFISIDGVAWYATGDLGFLDADGYLSITGRLKRFVKIAGEMISLPFLETILLETYGNREIVTLAVEAREFEGSVKIVLFSIKTLELEAVHELLRSQGVSNLVKIHEIQKLENIPILGTGKVDYRSLKEMI